MFSEAQRFITVFTRARKLLRILIQISPLHFVIAYVLVLCGQSVEFLLLNLVVHKISTKCHVQQFHHLPTECTSVIFMDLRTNSDYYYAIGFCDETVCLLRVTN